MSLREKTISGAKWSAMATIVIIGLGLVQMTVLARIIDMLAMLLFLSFIYFLSYTERLQLANLQLKIHISSRDMNIYLLHIQRT